MQKKIKYSDIGKLLVKKGILLPKSHEQEYCKKNRIMLARNSNGSTTLCSYGLSSDYKSARVELSMQSGSLNDPKNKAGAHHYLEHMLFNKKYRDIFLENDINANASTSNSRVRFYIDGLNNGKYKNFGVPAVLDTVYNSFFVPEGLDDKIYLKYEREVIKREIDEENGDFYKMAEKTFEEMLFEEDSFIRNNILGTEESLHNISAKDLKAIHKKYANPQNTIIMVSGESTKREMDYLFNTINKKISKQPKFGIKTAPKYMLDPKIKKFDSFNYLESRLENVKNNLCAVGFVTKLNIPIYSEEEFSMNALLSFLDRMYFEKIRDKGLIYSGYTNKYNFYNGDQIIYAVGFVPSSKASKTIPLLEKEFNNLLKQILNKKLLDKVYKSFVLESMAVPLSFSNKVKDFTTFYRLFGLIPNSMEFRKHRVNFGLPSLYQNVTKLLDSKKVLFKVGDF